MSSTIVSISESTLHFSTNPNRPHKKPPVAAADIFSGVSFSSHVSKSRISIGNSPGPHRARARPTARIEAHYAAAETRGTLYELLGISETGSSFSDIKKAYKQMARLYHPDVSPPERVDENTKKFIMVHEAYETLSDPYSRALYDRDLKTGSGFSFSATKKSRQYHQETEEKGEWRRRWEAQLDELQRRGVVCRGVLECAPKDDDIYIHTLVYNY